MNKSTKGAVAAAAAGVLLLGGAGSLAYWTDSATVTGANIATGNLSLSDDTCGDNWILDKGVVGSEATYASQVLVPGDTLTKVCTYKVNASGDHLSATLTLPESLAVTGTLESAATSESVPVNATYQLADDAVGTNPVTAGTTITSTDDGSFLIATITVDFTYGTDENGTPAVNGNDTQDKAGKLADIALTLVQADH